MFKYPKDLTSVGVGIPQAYKRVKSVPLWSQHHRYEFAATNKVYLKVCALIIRMLYTEE